MKTYINGSVKVLIDYAMTLLIFIIFLPAGFIQLPIYSIIIFLLGGYILYSDFNLLAVKERKPSYNTINYPLKGLVMGLLGFSPIMIIVILLNIINFGSGNGNLIKSGIVKILTAPIFGFISTNPISLLIIPAIVAVAYMAGHHGKEMPSLFKPKPKRKKVL
jgi:hypothetical protein